MAKIEWQDNPNDKGFVGDGFLIIEADGMFHCVRNGTLLYMANDVSDAMGYCEGISERISKRAENLGITTEAYEANLGSPGIPKE